MDGATADELLAIFNSRLAAADLHDIHIGSAILRPDGGCGQGLAIFRNVGDYDPALMQRIAIDRIAVDVGRIGPKLSPAPGVFAVKVQRVTAQIGSVAISYSGEWTPDLPHVVGLRFAPGLGQTMPLTIPAITVTVTARNAIPRGGAAMVWGPVTTDSLVVRGAGSGFRQIAFGAQDLKNVDARTTAFIGDPFLNSRRVRGRLNGRAADR